MKKLAFVLEDREKFVEADAAMSEVLEVQQRAYGLNHPNVIKEIRRYATFLSYQLRSKQIGQEKQAKLEELIKQAISVSEKVYGKDHLEYATVLAEQSTYLQSKVFSSRSSGTIQTCICRESMLKR